VVASIAPLHSLAAGVMAGVAEPRLLIAANASPHAYALRPSDARALSQAELVLWVGEGLENTMIQALASLSGKARLITLEQAEGVWHLDARKGGEWEGHEAHGHHHHGEHADHGEEYDSHLWLAPANARRIVELLRDALLELDPTHASHYQQNAKGMLVEIDALERRLNEQLAPVRQRPFIVFHDAYQYFEQSFELQAVGAITLSPERAPGARRLAEIRRVIAERQAVCVFSEPQFRPAVVKVALEGSTARHGELDPLGSTLAPGAGQWFQLMQGLADSLQQCLAQE
jgi:zinc transport system substrate-binding protein